MMRRMPSLSSNVPVPGQVGVGPDCFIMPEAFEDWYPTYASFSVLPDDVFVVTHPRSGTTWIQEMVWCLLHGRDSPEVKVELIKRFPCFEFDCLLPLNRIEPHHIPEDDFMRPGNNWKKVQEINSPRTIKSHLPKSLLPPHLWRIKSKVVYVCRDPRDVCVSFYFFCCMIRGYTRTMDDFVRTFLDGRVNYSPYWLHVLDFWKMRNEEHIFFIRYEDMLKDLPRVIRQVAAFLEVKIDDAEVATLALHCSFDQMKANPAVNNETFSPTASENLKFIRKGKAGDWKNHLTQEHVKAFKEWTERYLEGSDFPYYRDYE